MNILKVVTVLFDLEIDSMLVSKTPCECPPTINKYFNKLYSEVLNENNK